MPRQLQLEMHSQPDDTTCGPTCLHAVYRYYDNELSLEQVIREVPALEQGGTLAVMLGIHALRRGYQATIYTYNLRVFDPTWFVLTSSKHRLVPTYEAAPNMVERLGAQMQAKHSARLQAACQAYIDFCQLGGQLRMQDLNAALIRKYLKRSVPILTGLSFTYLYHCPREVEPAGTVDDIRGQATGHFVVLCGYDKQRKTVRVADPYPNPLGEDNVYEVGLDRLVCAILLGVLTYDANLLIIEPRRSWAGTSPQSDPLDPAA